MPRVLTAYLVDRQARGLSPQTIEYYSDELRRLQAFLEAYGIQHAEDVSADALRQYLLDLSTRRSSGGVHCSYRAVRAFLRWTWMEYELAPPCPIAKAAAPLRCASGTIAPRLSMQPLEPVSLDDVRAMLATCRGHSFTDDRDRAMLLALLDTGARAAEFLALDLADVNLSTGQAIILDIHLNGTTIWSTQANRLQIAATATSGTQTTFNTVDLVDGDVLTLDVDQVGSGTAGAELTVLLEITAPLETS